MKILSPILLLASLTVCLGDGVRSYRDDPATLMRILLEAVDYNALQMRGETGKELIYSPKMRMPYTGWGKEMYSNGQVSLLCGYQSGRQHGLETWWHENGQKWIERNFKDGELDGPMNAWHENGQKKAEINFKHGNKHGLETLWDEEGKVTSQTRWENGVKAETIK